MRRYVNKRVIEGVHGGCFEYVGIEMLTVI